MVNVDVMEMVKLLSGEDAKNLIESFEIEVPKKRYDEDEEGFLTRVCKYCLQADLLAGICNIVKVDYVDIFNHSKSIKAMMGNEETEKIRQIELPMKCHQEYSIRKGLLEKALNEAETGDVIVLSGNYPYGDDSFETKMKAFEGNLLNISKGGYLYGEKSDSIAFIKGDLIDLAYVLRWWHPVYHDKATYKVVKN